MEVSEVQRIQTAHRWRLVETWDIAPGSRILELGCGQGDMTAVLAEVVGPEGHVTAVDIADPSYGAPQTLAQATGLLKESPRGDRITFQFNFDILDPRNGFVADSFDYVVLAHCSWYFATSEQLARTFAAVRPWARNLSFAEWDLQPRSLDQLPHLLAVMIQGQVEAFKKESLSNIKTPLHRNQVKELLNQGGWIPGDESVIESESLQDADWEISACLRESLKDAIAMNLPSKVITFLEGELELLRSFAATNGNHPLPCYSFVASRTVDGPR